MAFDQSCVAECRFGFEVSPNSASYKVLTFHKNKPYCYDGRTYNWWKAWLYTSHSITEIRFIKTLILTSYYHDILKTKRDVMCLICGEKSVVNKRLLAILWDAFSLDGHKIKFLCNLYRCTNRPPLHIRIIQKNSSLILHFAYNWRMSWWK